MLGKGIYTPAEAAALLKAPAAEVRRWAFGYSRTRDGARVRYAPLIRTELPEVEGRCALTFVELVELMYIKAFRKAGAPWPLIREASAVAARLAGSDHPFATRKFFADPRGIYALLDEVEGGPSLVRLEGHGQHAFREIVQPYLRQLEFDPADLPSRWWPMGREGGVVVDPRRSFGAPVLASAGIPTRTLADMYRGERKYDAARALDRVARMYEIAPQEVNQALRFEGWRAAA